MNFLLSILVFILNLLDRIIYFLSSFCAKKRLSSPVVKSVELDVDEKRGESRPRVNVMIQGKTFLTTPVEGCSTLAELWKNSCKKYGEKDCMGKRDFLKMEKTTVTLQDGKTKDWFTPHFGELKYKSYNQISETVTNFGKGMKKTCGLKAQDYVGIYENTIPEWMQSALACFENSFVVVTVYSNLGDEALVHSIKQTEMSTIICSGSNVSKLLNVESEIPTLKNIIYIDEFAKKDDVKTNIKIYSFNEIEKIGKEAKDVEQVKPSPKDLAVIMYTSGSTGLPKGVMVTHGNFLGAIAAMSSVLGDLTKDTHLAYLPLAHIFELGIQLGILSNGARVGYGSPRTLTDANAKPFGDLKAVKPTLLIAVPRVYDTIRKGALEKVNASAISTFLYETAFQAKKDALVQGRDTPLWNWLVFKNFIANIGGNCQRCISGGAPLAPTTQEFIRIAFGIPIIQGYGLTETCAGGTVQDYRDFTPQFGNVGAPIPSCQLKLVDVPDMKYLTSEKPQRGEIWIKGTNVSLGYFKDTKKTQEAFTEDGWFKTGDVGRWNPDGTLSIIDRVKNLVKLAHGEYVAIESLESIYGGSPFVSPNGICVYGDSYKDFLVAVIVPQESYLKNYASTKGIEGNLEQLCQNKKIISAVLESLKNCAVVNKKKTFEEIKEIYIYPGEWTPENELLTAAMKLNRNVIVKKFKDEIDKLYSK